MPKIVPITLAAAMALSLGAPGPATAQGQTGAHGWTTAPERAPRAQRGQERPTRAAEMPDLRRFAPKLRTARAADSSNLPARMTQKERPGGTRSPATARPHATDPDTPRQATTRSAPVSLRAPLPQDGADGGSATAESHRSEPALAPRMETPDDTRTSRASFEDWLFGR